MKTRRRVIFRRFRRCANRRMLGAVAAGLLGIGCALPVLAQNHGPRANVPPALEIEVLDPGVDPQGNPAVLLHPDANGQMVVDIPPVILVHRYYYTGDRSFQAQMLPGGPSIVVANHPKTGVRSYVSVQMLPGAPRVHYRKKEIEYDYGDYGIVVCYGSFGDPKVKYRSGMPFHKKVGEIMHAQHWHAQGAKVVGFSKAVVAETKTSLHELYVDTANMTQDLTLPIKNLVRVIPLATPLFDPDRARLRAEKIAAYEREHAAKLAEHNRQLDEATQPTNR